MSMRPIQLVILFVAVGAAASAGLLAMKIGSGNAPKSAPVTAQSAPAIRLEQVLVATKDIGVGTVIGPDMVGWKEWPENGLNPNYLTRTAHPDAVTDLSKDTMLARSQILAGEPIRMAKLVSSDRGFLSAVLPSGMRAVAVRVNAASTAGGFILPEDRVDVMLVKQNNGSATAQTIMDNIRVLAIDQTVQQNEGDKKSLVAQNTATLELTPEQSELIVQAQQIGTISLALRSLADAGAKPDDTTSRRTSGVAVVKYGVVSRVTTTGEAN